MQSQDIAPKRQAQGNNHNIVNFPQRRPSKAEALTNYAHAKTDAERYRAMNALVLARLHEQERGDE